MNSMVLINSSIDEEILKKFRHVIYTNMGLKKGDFKKALENAMLDYIQKYSESESAKEKAKGVQSKKRTRQ